MACASRNDTNIYLGVGDILCNVSGSYQKRRALRGNDEGGAAGTNRW
jgi:hypothetical protein